MSDYYTLSISETIKTLKSTEKGLTQAEVQEKLKEHGYNEIKKEKKFTILILFFSQFKNGLILLLIFAGLLSLLLGEIIEAAAIYGIVLLNAILGFIQEYRAEKSMEALKKIAAPIANVMRDGKEQQIPAREIVLGDIMLLESGDIIPADSRIIEEASLQIDEASLTGESVPSKKTAEQQKTKSAVSDQHNMAFMGTAITYGKGKSIVTATGMNTEFGKIATALQTTKEVQTPLQLKFTQLAKQIGIIAIILILLVFVMGIIQKTLTFGKMLLFALALTVSTIPNSLPLVVTVGLSLGTKRLAKKNMLIKKLPAAESLGAATIICSDKTGTITKNQMTITDIYFDGQQIKVSGTGYEPKGNFQTNNKQINPKQIEPLIKTGYLCNNAKLTQKDNKYQITGDPTEGALIVLGKKGKLDEELQKNYTLIQELPFDSDRKRMTKIYKNNKNKKTEAYVKGAPDILLKHCDRILEKNKIRKLTQKDKEKILKINDTYAENALRVLGLAYKEVKPAKKYKIEETEKNLIFIGLTGMIDPPRDEVKQAIEQCKQAGIQVMIITGDHALTTKAVSQQIGLFKQGDIVLTGEDIDKMNDKELEQKIQKIRIIARALPIQKSRIVDTLQKKGHIVAMTGDGVNDAPALKKADIGIAMGITGTGVAKEVSKAILTDDNFATIVNAIEEGRNIYEKMIKSAKYLLSCNAGEIISVLIAILLHFPLPLLPLQILLMNLLTDDFPALGLGMEASEEGIMQRPPRNPKEKPITKKILVSIVAFGLIMGAGTLFMFIQYKDINLSKAQTIAFTTLVMFQMFAVISSRTLYHSIKHINLLTNKWLLGAIMLSIAIQIAVIYIPPLQIIFGTVPLTAIEWMKIIAIASIGFVIMEASKFFMHKKTVNHTTA